MHLPKSHALTSVFAGAVGWGITLAASEPGKTAQPPTHTPSALEGYLRDDWREFVFIVTVTLTLMMLVRTVTYRAIIADAARRNHGWFEVLCVGCDLCFLAIGGLFVFARLLDRGAIPGRSEGVAMYVAITMILLLLAAVISSFSQRHVTRLVFSADALLAMHIPNALGIATVYVAASLMRGL